MLDKKQAHEIAVIYADKVTSVLSPDSIILFGSYINGTPHEYSDIDIAVIMNDFQNDWLETASMLCGLAWDVSFDIEPHLLDAAHDPSGFVKHVLETGSVLYQA
jgi:predicted nucleotidyltransferase